MTALRHHLAALGALFSAAAITLLIDCDAALTLPATSAAFAVSVWVPIDRALVVMLQVPVEFAVPVPTTTVPS